jgi:hypothetical protein
LTIKRFTEIRILKNIIDIWILEGCTKICCRWKDNIKMDLSGSGMWGYGQDCAGSGERQVVGTCECGSEILLILGYWKDVPNMA